jgi:hypothetical protein
MSVTMTEMTGHDAETGGHVGPKYAIEMFQFRQVLVRLRAGDTAREIARSGLLGRDKLIELTRLARTQGWLEPGCELPDDETIVTALAPRKRASSTVSSAEPLREVVQRWFDAGVQGSAH